MVGLLGTRARVSAGRFPIPNQLTEQAQTRPLLITAKLPAGSTASNGTLRRKGAKNTPLSLENVAQGREWHFPRPGRPVFTRTPA
jgi:hypothetical protein